MHAEYPALYYKTSVTIAWLVVFPLLFILPFVLAGIYIEMPDWMLLLEIMIGMAISILGMLYFYKRWITAECTIVSEDIGFTIRLSKKYPFYSQSFFVALENIKNISGNTDANGNQPFIQVSCFDELGSFTLSPTKQNKTHTDDWDLWQDLDLKVKRFNSGLEHPKKIKQTGFYQGTWAKIIATAFLLLFIISIVIKIVDNESIDWIKIVAFGGMGFYFILNVVVAMRKELKKNKSI
jgi:hypothetical protein